MQRNGKLTQPPETEVEFIFVIIGYLIDVLIFATTVGNISPMITNMNASRTEFQSRIDAVEKRKKVLYRMDTTPR
jgi:hypothetical protein